MISVLTPSVRPEGLKIVYDCLKKQTFQDWHWLISAPQEVITPISEVTGKFGVKHNLFIDPPKKEGDFWSLCKGWNNLYANAEGQLIVNIQDMIWFPPDTLERFWEHYVKNPKALVTAVGNHYDQLDEYGKPIHEVWQDPRKRQDLGTFYRIDNPDMEMSVCSIPKQAILDCGGIDEEYDKGPGVQEKEMCLRLEVLGYEMWIDQSIEYRAVKHGRLTEDWDDKYWKVTAPMYERHVKEMLEIKRPLNVGNIEKYLA